MMEYCNKRGVLYTDTVVEPWLGAYTDASVSPGMVSHFVKQALVNIAKDTGLGDVDPKTKREWGELAQRLGIKTIHIAERDTQVREKPKEVGEFVNTWSIDGFISEGCQPSEMGWGTHEKQLPPDGHHHTVGSKSAIWLNQPGVR